MTINYQTLKLMIDPPGVLRIGLNRPDSSNAFNPQLINELTQVFEKEALEKQLRIILLYGEGKTFCAGADLHWMKDCAQYSEAENFSDAQKFSHLLNSMQKIPIPIMARVHGAAMGGGLGLMSLCDYVILEAGTKLSFSETKLGLIPAVIGPFILDKIGMSWTKALFLSARTFSAEEALRFGLVHQVVTGEVSLKNAVEEFILLQLKLAPQAVKICKDFIRRLSDTPANQRLLLASRTLAEIRVSDEAREGLAAFLEKREPTWVKSS